VTFEGCKGAPCKCAALGVVCLCVYAVLPDDQFCEQQHKPTYCNLAWDMPHGPHNDQPINNNWVRGLSTVAASTSSTNTVVETNPHFVAKFVPARLIVWPFLRSPHLG
jgi:hypothetical protein